MTAAAHGWGRWRIARAAAFAVMAVLTATRVWLFTAAAGSEVAAAQAQQARLASSVLTLRLQVTYCAAHPHDAYCGHPAAPAPGAAGSGSQAVPALGLTAPLPLIVTRSGGPPWATP